MLPQVGAWPGVAAPVGGCVLFWAAQRREDKETIQLREQGQRGLRNRDNDGSGIATARGLEQG